MKYSKVDCVSLRVPSGEYIEFGLEYTVRKTTERLKTVLAPGSSLDTPTRVRMYLSLYATNLEHEVFGVIFLNSQNQVIEHREMFRGTLTQTAVYPREIAKLALQLNACSLIFWHNHPSGMCTPSHADCLLTNTLKAVLTPLEIRVLDHLVVTATDSYSMAEHGQI